MPSSETPICTTPTPLLIPIILHKNFSLLIPVWGDTYVMAVPSAFAIFAVIPCILLHYAQAHAMAPAPAPASDGTSIDQEIAYLLMLVALIVTYLFHTMDATFS